MVRFSPPARIDDFGRSAKPDELAEGWDAVIDDWLTRAASEVDGRFYNPNQAGAPVGGTEAPIVWDAFPLVIKRWYESEIGGDRKMYRAADTPRPMQLRAVRDGALAEQVEVFRRQQDEYCEWFVERRDGAITSIQFTSEGPEYWRFLMTGTASFFAEGDARRDITTGDPDLVLTLYREHISSDVQLEDLLWPYDVAERTRTGWRFLAFAGEYNEFNRWTTTDGAMHLTHRSNTLQAEVQLAAGATVLRNIAAGNARSLTCCAGFGDVNRSSDPLIGLAVNRAVAAGKSLTLADPIGLYISSINVAALSDPAAWTPARGSVDVGKILRARIDVPPGGMQVGGLPLEYGGQVAEHIQMILTGLVNDAADGSPPVRNCVTTCCTHPNRADFRTVVDPQENCGTIAWSSLAPFLQAEPGGPGLALADAAGADVPAPAGVPEGVEIQPRGTAPSARR
jgi:hypothetical protein